MKKFTILFSCLCLFLSAQAQKERQPVVQLSTFVPGVQAFKNVTVVVSPDLTVENATLVVRDGIIEAVGTNVTIPNDAVVREMRGCRIYPGLIDAAAEYGLTAIKRMPYSDDEESGPQYKSLSATATHWNDAIKSQNSVSQTLQIQKDIAKELRALGFTTVNIFPNDGICRGTGALIQLGDTKIQSEMLKTESCAAFSFNKGTSKQVYPSSWMGAIALLRQTFLDADYYKKNPAELNVPGNEANLSLSALNRQIYGNMPLIFETTSWQHTLAAAEIARENGLQMIYKTAGDEYMRIEALKALKSSFIVPLKFPKAYDIKSIAEGREISLGKLKEWEQAPMNPMVLSQNKVPFAITTSGTTAADFTANLQKAILYGLSEPEALRALTVTPATLLGVQMQLGTLEKGKIANFVIASGSIFRPESKIYEVYVGGTKYALNPFTEWDARANYTFRVPGNDSTFTLRVKGDSAQQFAEVLVEGDTASLKVMSFSIEQNRIAFTFKTKSKAVYSFSGMKDAENAIVGNMTDENGRGKFTTLTYKDAFSKNDKPKEGPKPVNIAEIAKVTYPNKAYGWEVEPKQIVTLIKNVNVWTNTDKGVLEGQDVLLENGKIVSIAQGIKEPKNARIIEGEGRHLTCGIIDEHSHIAIKQGVNEYSHAVTAEVRIGDALDAEDINIYRQLAGGVTSAQLLHGSANPIGGQSQVIKLRWGVNPDELKFEEAPGFIKFALGENVKQSNAGDRNTVRYPQTRMGVEQMIRDAFQAAKDYRAEMGNAGTPGKKKGNAPTASFKRDLQLDALLEVLDGKRYITCHSYVQSEVTMLIRLAEEMGFKVNTFTHILEGYKIADKLQKHGANASTFSDWWAYKYEVMEATPYNAAVLAREGVNVCINSDDPEMGRRLNQEAAKGIKYGGMTEQEAWKMVTLNPAKALHIDQYVGTLEVGKHADVVLWTQNPLSIYSKPVYTFVDGILYFDLEKDGEMRSTVAKEHTRILSKMMTDPGSKEDASKGRKGKNHYHCDSEEGYEEIFE